MEYERVPSAEWTVEGRIKGPAVVFCGPFGLITSAMTTWARFRHYTSGYLEFSVLVFSCIIWVELREASLPMACTSTLLLLIIVVALNAAAIGLRSRLRRWYSLAAA